MVTEKDLDQLLAEYSESMGFPGKGRVWARMTKTPVLRGRRWQKMALICAAILVFTAANVFADDLADVLKEISLYRFNATQRDTLISPFDMSPISASLKVTYDASVRTPSPEDSAAISDWEFFTVDSAEAVLEMLKFVRLPRTLPGGFAFESATLIRYPSGALGPSVQLVYENGDQLSSRQIGIEEFHVGDSGVIDLETVDAIETVRIGGVDAIRIAEPLYDSCRYVWVQDGIAYQVSALDEETARAAAEGLITYSS